MPTKIDIRVSNRNIFFKHTTAACHIDHLAFKIFYISLDLISKLHPIWENPNKVNKELTPPTLNRYSDKTGHVKETNLSNMPRSYL